MHNLLKELREEEKTAIAHIKNIEEAINKIDPDNVIPKETMLKWLEQYHANMTASFRMSEEIIKHYMIKNLEEFKYELKEIMDKV